MVVRSDSTSNQPARVFTSDGHYIVTDPYFSTTWDPQEDTDGVMAKLVQAKLDDNLPRLDEAIYVMASYDGFYHIWAEVLPRLLSYLAMSASSSARTPKEDLKVLINHVPGAVGSSLLGIAAAYAQASLDWGLTVESISVVESPSVLRVKSLYVPLDLLKPLDDELWGTISPECSSVLASDAARVRSGIEAWLGTKELQNPKTSDKPVMLVINRRDAHKSARSLGNHLALIEELQVTYGDTHQVIEFIGSKHTLDESFRLFSNADVVIGPHGAAFAFAQALKPGTALVELSFHETRANGQLTYDFFRLMASKLGLVYGLVMCHGTYKTPLIAPLRAVLSVLDEVVRTKMAPEW